MSRQRIRSSVLESSTDKCPNCGGTGHVRSVSSVALQLLRAIEEMLLKGATHNLTVRTRADIALYLLNQKRAHLRALEERFRISILVNADASIAGQVSFLIEKGEQVHSLEQAKALPAPTASAEMQPAPEEEAELEEERVNESAAVEEVMSLYLSSPGETSDERDADEPELERPSHQAHARKRRRRRRGRRGGESREHEAFAQEEAAAQTVGHSDAQEHEERETVDHAGDSERTRANAGRGRRRRGRRGGREHRRDQTAAREDELSGSMLGHTSSDAELGGTSGAEPAQITAAEPVRPTPEPEHMNVEAHQHPAESGMVKSATSEQARRRSTVREPALVASQDHASSQQDTGPKPGAIEPVISSSTESERDERPPKSGWWSKRIFGRS
jgi:ribonuclease E